MTKVAKNLISDAKSELKSVTSSASGATKIVRLFLQGKATKKWASSCGFVADDFDKKGHNLVEFYGSYDKATYDGTTLDAIALETVYEVDENSEFVLVPEEYHVGETTYTRKVKKVAFYRYTRKTKWSIADVIDAYSRKANYEGLDYTESYKLEECEVPFIKDEKGKLVRSFDPEHVRRATNEVQKAEATQRYKNQHPETEE